MWVTPWQNKPFRARICFYRLENGNNSYTDREQFLPGYDCSLSKAIQAFYDAGCRYLQLDDTAWADLFSDAGHDKLRAKGLEPAVELKTMQRMINETLAHKPADLVVTMHICRGNYKSNFSQRVVTIMLRKLFLEA